MWDIWYSSPRSRQRAVNTSHRARARGEGPRYRLLILYALCYAPVRFVLEFFRGDSARGGLGPLSTSQWISLAVLAGILIWQLARRRVRPGDASKE